MPVPVMDRRVVLKAAAVSIGATAAGVFPLLAAPIQAEGFKGGAVPSDRDWAIAAGIHLHPDGRAQLRFAAVDANGGTILAAPIAGLEPQETMLADDRSSAWGQALQACALAENVATQSVARSWGLQARDCETRGSRIVHVPSGRSVRYFAWVAFA